VYPVLVRIGGVEITSFGVLVAIGGLVGVWVFRRELARSGLPESAIDAGIAGVLGGLVGAKLLWTVEHRAQAPILDLLLSRGGLSWFGGFAGGVAAGLAVMSWKRLPKVAVLAAATPGLAIGHAIGRIGCFLVGDDYGHPTTLPWGVAFPQGLPPTTVPVHPTQLYEMALLLPLGWLLIHWRRDARPDSFVLGAYLVLAGLIRFSIEFLRVNVRVAGNLSVAHLAALAAVTAGVVIGTRGRRGRAASATG
jgi:phosphatidylglycerol:prolipoprotein diacylglycerol transferase